MTPFWNNQAPPQSCAPNLPWSFQGLDGGSGLLLGLLSVLKPEDGQSGHRSELGERKAEKLQEQMIFVFFPLLEEKDVELIFKLWPWNLEL